MDDYSDEKLSVDNLIKFLQDSVFVEYFNSFLLLPSFPCHVYYDEQLGIFESVQADCSTPALSRTTSTVYLTHSKLIQFANPSVCENWVVTHRLPLFIHSDLYSEYRLLKTLTKSASGFFDTCLQQQDKKTVQQDRKPHKRRHSVTSGRLSARQGRRSSLSSAGWSRTQRISPLQEKINLLMSKMGMEMFKRFLAGKLGEENLMFWIEAESLKNIQKSIEYASGMKRLRMKYPNVFQQLSSSQRTLSIDKMVACVNELQLSSLENLKQYWYPRFLVGELVSSASVSLPSVKLPSTHQPLDNNHHTRLSYPATPTYRKLPKAKSSHQIQPAPTVDRTSSSMPHLPEPTTRVKQQRATTTDGRDTCRTKYSNRQTIASTTVNTVDSNTRTYGRNIGFSKSSEGPRSLSLLDSPRTGGKNDIGPTSSNDRCKLSSRRIWSRDSSSRDSSMDDAISRSSRLATYNRYPLVPCSRTSCNLTTLEQDWSRSQSPVCPPRSPQILSVSGTPVPMESQFETIKPDYKSLLKCLSLEKYKAGGFFQKHLELIPNKVNINCLYFWREVQEYKELFLQCSFSISSVELKAKVIYGRYIYEGSSESISCPAATAETILERMWPAFEDLFDEAEEHVLAMLLKQWEELCELEHRLFESLLNIEPDNEISSYPFNELEKLSEECGSSYASLASVGSSYLESENEDGDEVQGGAESPCPLQGSMLAPGDWASSSSNVIGNVNHESKDNGFEEKPVVKEMAFSDLMANPRELEYFKMYLNDNKGAIHLMCWMEIEAFRAIPANDKAVRNMKAKQLRTKYFNKTYFFGPSSPATKETQRQVVDVGGSHKLGKRPTSAVFREAQKHVRLKVEQFVRSFVKTSDFMERMGTKSKKTGRKEAQINDVHFQSTRHVESHDTILLRKMLTCDEDKQLFQYFVTIQTPEGSCPLGKQVDFWLEVQRYKTMFHSQMNAKLLQDKMKAIITCYFQSCSPPRLQLNIPAQVAEETTKKKFSPYVFRESQAAVFRNLQSYWNEYQNFLQDRVGAIVNKRTVEEAIKSLKEQIAEERAKVKEMVEMEQMEQERTKLSLPRFETIEEKNQRLMKEKELKEFGEVGVSFRLSHLSPQFKFYFGDEEGNIMSLHEPLIKPKTKKTVHYETEE